MTNELRQLIKENAELLKDKKFEELLNIAKDESLQLFKELKSLFFTLAIDVPAETGTIPAKYFADSDIRNYITPKNVTRINFGAFQNCENLERIILHDDIEYIASNAFKDCNSLEYISIPPKIKVLKSKLFEGCKNLKSVQLNAGLNIIGDQVFEDCINLEEISIPNSVEHIYIDAFRGCKNLKQIKFGSGLKKIEADICLHCNNLKDVYYNGTISQWKNIDIDYLNYELFKCVIHCTDGDHIYTDK